MWILKLLNIMYYRCNEKRRMYIMTKFNDYEKFIEQQQKAVSKIKEETSRIAAILNLYNAYYFNDQLEKAEETIKSLDIDSLDNSIKCIYYYYLLNHYIAANNEIMVDKLWEESQSLLEEMKQKDNQFYRNLQMNYNNFKGLYEKSNKILLEVDYDGKDDIFYTLLKTEIYFNVGKENEAKLIINDLLNGKKKLVPIFKKKIKDFQMKYMNEDEKFINKNKTNEKISFKDKVWSKVRDSDFMRNLLLLFIDVKNILKNKYVLLIFGPIIAVYLWKIIGIIGLKNNTYWNYWNYLILDILSNVAFINLVGLLINYMIKRKKYLKAMLIILVLLSCIGFNFSAKSYSLSLKARIIDLPYVVSKSYVEEVTTIKYIDIVNEEKYQYIQIETNNNKFQVFSDDNVYDYILQNCCEGDVVKIKYLPNTKNIIYINLERK
ncbi:hypothetical protein ACFIJ5_13880 [Haloimpatiens sp. FM7330]|uniref:hypothetical protein n=1 Tax=Haloimpatiens sp. FM7330 TaxID=3298610 RepID=UPI00362A9CAE